jgi:UDP-N-acetylmuramoyl-tripeptide--D-alanyl-D-alanine ligase
MLSGDASMMIDEVVTDSRQKSNKAMFIALKGDRFDGHDFAGPAAANGAAAVLVHKQIDGLMCPYILVKDTTKALADLAQAKRKGFHGKVIGITGSSGKTTTRRLVHAILSKKMSTLQPVKNFNNHIGVPFTMLDMDDTFSAAVLELGCSDFGEIAALTKISDPDVGLITNVGPAHLEKLVSLDGVARAKGELFLHMRKEGTAVVNGDDERICSMSVPPKRKVVYGTATNADVRLLKRKSLGKEGQQLIVEIFGKKTDIELSLLGEHNAMNALAATATAAALNVEPDDIRAGIAEIRPESGRLTPIFTKELQIIDDTYNANPASMRAALDTLREMAGDGRTVAILGDMLELGAESEAAHLEIGRKVKDLGIDVLITAGKGGRTIALGAIHNGMNPKSCVTAEDAAQAAFLSAALIRPEDWVLVKGSRGMKMETVTAALHKRSV